VGLGYARPSFWRARSTVKSQLILAPSALRRRSQRPTSATRESLSGIRRSRHSWTIHADFYLNHVEPACVLRREVKAPHPMLDPALFRCPAFSSTLVAIMLAYLAFSGSSFAVAQYLQVVRAHAPSVASWLNLPLPLAMLLGTLSAPRLSSRLGPGRVLGVSLRIAVGGAVLVAIACCVRSDLGLCAALVPFAVGAGSAFANATQVILSLAPPERAGSAAAISETAFELGGVLGIAQLGTRLGTASGPLGASLALTGAAVALGVAALLSGTLSGGTPPHAWAPKTMESKRLFG